MALDPKVEPSPNEISDIRWVSKAELEAFFLDPGELSSHSSPFASYHLAAPLLSSTADTRQSTASSFTPWFKLIAESFLYKWWDALIESKIAGQPLDTRVLLPEVEAKADEIGRAHV